MISSLESARPHHWEALRRDLRAGDWSFPEAGTAPVLPGGELSSSESDVGHMLRQWLTSHKFPPGFVAVPGTGGLSATLDALKNDGWTTMKSGIGRTRAFADMLLQHRMEVVVVPELPKGELPRKAKAAKDWKEVRKKL